MDLELAWKILPKLLSGAVLTVVLVSQSIILGFVIAVPIALARLSRKFFLRAFSYLYIMCFRGTPLLVLIFLLYYGAAQFEAVRESWLWFFLREAYWCGILSMTLCTSAYAAEIFRGAIVGVPKGEIEAGLICGMSRWQVFRRIILPHAFRLALPAYTNEVIFLVKGSALLSTITIIELTGAATTIYYHTFDPFTPFLFAGAIYVIINLMFIRISRRFEHFLGKHATA